MKVYDAVKADLDGFDVMQAFPNNEIRFTSPWAYIL